MAQLVRRPAHRAGDPGSNPGPGENFSLKLLRYSKNSYKYTCLCPVIMRFEVDAIRRALVQCWMRTSFSPVFGICTSTIYSGNSGQENQRLGFSSLTDYLDTDRMIINFCLPTCGRDVSCRLIGLGPYRALVPLS